MMIKLNEVLMKFDDQIVSFECDEEDLANGLNLQEAKKVAIALMSVHGAKAFKEVADDIINEYGDGT